MSKRIIVFLEMIYDSIKRYFLSSRLLGLTYISLVPAFSVFYTLAIPSDFAHSNLMKEAEFYEDIKSQIEETEKQIRAELQKTEFPGTARISYFGDLDYRDSSFSFGLKLSGDGDSLVVCRPEPGKGCLISYYLPCNISKIDGFGSWAQMDETGAWSSDHAPDYDIDCGMYTQAIHEALGINTSLFSHRLLKHHRDAADRNLKHGALTADDIVLELMAVNPVKNIDSHLSKLNKIEMQNDGIYTVPSWNVFLRMTYFSVVTITTLGYGDISPVSNTARVAVAIESLLGIVVIGLFLNALSRNP